VRILDAVARRARRPGHCNLIVLHDLNLARRFCSHALLLYGNGEWRAGVFPEIASPAALSDLYGCDIREIRDQHGSALVAS
jgi:iron complex transport system ATP-binding protein